MMGVRDLFNNIRAIMPNMPSDQTEIITNNIVAKVKEAVFKELNNKYREDFDKIAVEFKKVAVDSQEKEAQIAEMQKYIKSLEDRISALEAMQNGQKR
jgi:hypothetical protein